MFSSIFQKFNLAYPEKSDIKFHINSFPDGQQSVDIIDTQLVKGEDIKIYSRIRSFRDIELIICANQALRQLGVSSVSLYVPFFLGSRSDRKFKEGGVNYLKNVIAPIINSQNFDCVLTLDPHSDVLEAVINNYEKIDNRLLVKSALTKIDNRNDAQDRIILVSPDGGALKKIYDLAEHFKIPNVITATKHRDISTGKITHTEVPLSDNIDANHMHYHDCKFVIIDDICDGGRTFIELAKAIKDKVPDAKIYLIVTHGLFTSGFDQLNIYFEKVFTTNSYADVSIGETNAEGNSGYGTYDFNGFAKSGSIARTDLLTQLNVF
jgi:ribose-phosphate pyrophosphokinase